MKNPHYYHSYYDYDSYNHYNSKWNSTLQRMVNKSLTDDSMIQKIIEANLQYLQIVKGVDIAKKFAKQLREHHMNTFKARIDYLNNLKVEDNYEAKSVV